MHANTDKHIRLSIRDMFTMFPATSTLIVIILGKNPNKPYLMLSSQITLCAGGKEIACTVFQIAQICDPQTKTREN